MTVPVSAKPKGKASPTSTHIEGGIVDRPHVGARGIDRHGFNFLTIFPPAPSTPVLGGAGL